MIVKDFESRQPESVTCRSARIRLIVLLFRLQACVYRFLDAFQLWIGSFIDAIGKRRWPFPLLLDQRAMPRPASTVAGTSTEPKIGGF